MKPAPDQSYDVIIIGTWRYIKGVDLLSKVCTDMGLNLLHVGGQFANCPFPNTPLFTHVPPVDEKELTNYLCFPLELRDWHLFWRKLLYPDYPWFIAKIREDTI